MGVLQGGRAPCRTSEPIHLTLPAAAPAVCDASSATLTPPHPWVRPPRSPSASRRLPKTTPWWAWVGGPLGAFYVAVAIIYAPVLGAATLMALFVTCQLATAVVLDALGWVGFPKRPLHWARLLGVGLMVTGVVLVTVFDGAASSSSSGSGSSAGTDDAATVPPGSRAGLSDTERGRAPPDRLMDATAPAAVAEAVAATVGEAAAVGLAGPLPGPPPPATTRMAAAAARLRARRHLTARPLPLGRRGDGAAAAAAGRACCCWAGVPRRTSRLALPSPQRTAGSLRRAWHAVPSSNPSANNSRSGSIPRQVDGF
jgi:hypothetical protein